MSVTSVQQREVMQFQQRVWRHDSDCRLSATGMRRIGILESNVTAELQMAALFLLPGKYVCVFIKTTVKRAV